MNERAVAEPVVVAVCLSAGGIPKIPQPVVTITKDGIEGDAHSHAKHIKPTRALSILDEEILRDLRAEGYNLVPGSIGENITVRNLNVQAMAPGTILEMGAVKIRLEAPRKPCYVLDPIDQRFKEIVVGRCGYMASVIQGGELRPNTPIVCLDPEAAE